MGVAITHSLPFRTKIAFWLGREGACAGKLLDSLMEPYYAVSHFLVGPQGVCVGAQLGREGVSLLPKFNHFQGCA